MRQVVVTARPASPWLVGNWSQHRRSSLLVLEHLHMYIERHPFLLEKRLTTLSLRKGFALRHSFRFEFTFKLSILALYLALLGRRSRHPDYSWVVDRF